MGDYSTDDIIPGICRDTGRVSSSNDASRVVGRCSGAKIIMMASLLLDSYQVYLVVRTKYVKDGLARRVLMSCFAFAGFYRISEFLKSQSGVSQISSTIRGHRTRNTARSPPPRFLVLVNIFWSRE